MRIILINPPSPWLISDTDVLPLGLLYIAAAVKNYGAECIVCDLAGLSEDQWKIPVGDIYGITGTSPHFNHMARITEILKSREPEKMVVWGGPHATIMPEHILTKTKVDICILGEGEKNFPLLLAACNDGKKAYRHIKGIAYRSKRHIKINYPGRIKNLDSMQPPARDDVDIFKYSKTKTSKYIIGDCRETTIFTSRGCPYNCAFCAQNKLWGGKVVFRDIRSIERELQALKHRYGINLIWIMDDTFMLNKQLTSDVCKVMDELGLYWHCLSRVDKIDDETIKMMYNSGCKQIMFGLESGSDKMLKHMNKMFTTQQAKDAVEIVKRYDIKIRGQMIVGFPFEDDSTIRETAKFIKDFDVDAWGLHIFQPFPGCDVWDNPEKYKYKLDKQAAINNGFKDFHTIGKPNEAPTDDQNIKDWLIYLRGIADKKNIHDMGAQDD